MENSIHFRIYFRHAYEQVLMVKKHFLCSLRIPHNIVATDVRMVWPCCTVVGDKLNC
jgi:hypothetical protein